MNQLSNRYHFHILQRDEIAVNFRELHREILCESICSNDHTSGASVSYRLKGIASKSRFFEPVKCSLRYNE